MKLTYENDSGDVYSVEAKRIELQPSIFRTEIEDVIDLFRKLLPLADFYTIDLDDIVPDINRDYEIRYLDEEVTDATIQ